MVAQQPEHPPGPATAQERHWLGGMGAMLRRSWPVLKYVVGVVLLAISIWVLSSHTNELSGLSKVFDTLKWWWVPPALLAEFGSFVCFAGMQYAILKSGDLVAPKSALLKMDF